MSLTGRRRLDETLFKWTAIGPGVAVGVAVLAAAGMMLATDMRLAKTYTVAVAQPAISSDPAAIEEGRHLAEVYCMCCHGEKLEGGPFFAEEGLGYVDAPNLTGGSGGVGAAYDNGDWVRAIRHGIRPDGKQLFIMSSGDFQHFSDGDLAALIAYLKRVPPADNQTRARQLTPLARILYTAGAFGNLIPAEWIDHARQIGRQKGRQICRGRRSRAPRRNTARTLPHWGAAARVMERISAAAWIPILRRRRRPT